MTRGTAKGTSSRSPGKDVHLIRKQEEVLQESLMMIPDCQRRLLKAFEDLKKMIDAEENFDDTEAFFEAKNVLKEAEIQINKDACII
ncbi:tubulin-specific chaperone A [Copidosoma floridanum]|uniref:tubulin-specific chaperone A n=1 Tax=Copidosoma floridanum TaxID=29053 RepID=UPI000C6FAAA1|nr:tubulin-specific chaperone A [Copidosoma floridanum]